jgi:hypothetical protein
MSVPTLETRREATSFQILTTDSRARNNRSGTLLAVLLAGAKDMQKRKKISNDNRDHAEQKAYDGYRDDQQRRQ